MSNIYSLIMGFISSMLDFIGIDYYLTLYSNINLSDISVGSFFVLLISTICCFLSLFVIFKFVSWCFLKLLEVYRGD